MKQDLQIGEVIAVSGTKARGFLNLTGTNARTPVIVVNGTGEGKTLLVTAGIHGGEYPSIEAAIRFSRELDPSTMNGQVIVLPLVSLNAFHARQAFLVPEDGKNLNRQFPGKATGTVSERMAHAIMIEVVPHIQAWVDLHGGDIPEGLLPFLGYIKSPDIEVDNQVKAMAEVFGIKHVVRPDHLPGTSISAAAALGIPGLLAEAGQVGILDEENTEILLQGCRNVATHLGILPGTAAPTDIVELSSNPWVRAQQAGCWYPSVKVGEEVEADAVVGVVKDYFGDVLMEYRSPARGIILLVCAALAVNTNDPLIGVGAY